MLLASAVAMTADNIDRSLRIHNDTGVTLYRFKSTNSGAKTWGSDVMGNSTLPSGSSMMLNFDNKYDYCEFDFQAEFADGDILDTRRVNVCVETDFYYR